MKIFKYQQWHVLVLTLLLTLIYFLTKIDASLFKGEFYGISTLHWFIFGLLVPILHQFYVLVCWRFELYYKGVSKLLGKNGFKFYKAIFAILILSRPISITLLAISNANTISINTLFSYTLAIALFIPSAYLFYSVKKYFGVDRACGIDHFNPEKFKNAPMVKQGIFKYTSNGMYIYGFFLLWIPGILLQSKAALVLALFNHIYIWVHYYFTELPDMKVIYKNE